MLLKNLLFCVLLLSFVSCASIKMGRPESGIVKKESSKSFDDVKALAIKNLKKKGLTIMAVIDHDKNASRVGHSLSKTSLIIFGNPKIGTPLMKEAKSIALDLPQKILIYEENKKTHIQYNDPDFLRKRHGLKENLPRIKKVSHVLDSITNSLL